MPPTSGPLPPSTGPLPLSTGPLLHLACYVHILPSVIFNNIISHSFNYWIDFTDNKPKPANYRSTATACSLCRASRLSDSVGIRCTTFFLCVSQVYVRCVPFCDIIASFMLNNNLRWLIKINNE